MKTLALIYLQDKLWQFSEFSASCHQAVLSDLSLSSQNQSAKILG